MPYYNPPDTRAPLPMINLASSNDTLLVQLYVARVSVDGDVLNLEC